MPLFHPQGWRTSAYTPTRRYHFNRLRLYAAGLLLALSIPSGPVNAQPPTAAGLPDPLTLQAAVDQALQHNYAIRAAAAEVRRFEGEAVHAGRWVPSNPVLDVKSAERDAPGGTSTDIGISLAQEVWTGGKRRLQASAADARSQAARGRLEFLHTSTAARTRRAFLQVLLAREARRTGQRLLTAAQELQRYTRRRLEAGEATALAVNTAAIGVARARAELSRADRDLTRARLALAELLAVDPGQDLNPAGRLQPVALELPDRETLLQRSLERRSDLAAAAQAVVAAQKELQLTRRQLIPNLTIMGFYEEEESAEILGGGLSVSLPLLHRYRGEQQSASARLQQDQVARDALRLQVRREVLQALADYRSAREQVEVAGETMLSAAEQNLALTRTAFRAGKVGAPAITTAQDNLLSVRRTYLTALEELIVAGTALESATGGLIRMHQGVSQPASQESTR